MTAAAAARLNQVFDPTPEYPAQLVAMAMRPDERPPAVAEEEAAGVRGGDPVQLQVGDQQGLLPRGGPGHHPAVGRADEALAGELEPLLLADPVAERGEVTVLERGGRMEPHAGFIAARVL